MAADWTKVCVISLLGFSGLEFILFNYCVNEGDGCDVLINKLLNM